MFSKPMNPVQASNVHNYAVHENLTTTSGTDDFLASAVGILARDGSFGGGVRTSKSTMSVPLRSANYDPADFTVTLIPRRKLPALGSESGDLPSFVVTPGSPAKTSAPLRHRSSSAQGLTDLEGNAINQGNKPGKFRIVASFGYTPLGCRSGQPSRRCGKDSTPHESPPSCLPAHALPLEGRILLARMQAPPPVSHPQVSVNDEVSFNTGLGLDSTEGTQQVAQQAGEATIRLRRGYPGDTVYVEVATDPSSPAVGVNLPAVNQMVMFADGQTNASVTFPINAGAPNPGEVDVNLTITPIDPPPPGAGGPLELRIMAPDATTPPKIIEVDGTPQAIKLTFSKPMNPVQASNVHNYTVRSSWTTTSVNDGFLDSTPIGWLSPDAPLGGTKTTHGAKLVALRSANYDPADFTVTLIPKHKVDLLRPPAFDRRDPGERRRRPRPRFGTGQAPPKVSLTWRATRSAKAGNLENSRFTCILGILPSPDEGRSARSCGSFRPAANKP